ncbi:MAG: 1-acyl-sn-glycerol-3-phosphate acyltransferase [Candidatus Egerieousia sp.]
MGAKQKIAKFLLKMLGWKGMDGVVPEDKCVILGVPHTSAWDFVISWLFYTSVGGKANIMIKKEFFVWPIGPILRACGAIPVDRSKGANVAVHCINAIKESEKMHLAIAPEGTRKKTDRWKTGFHTIAKNAGVPVYLGYFNWKTKEVGRGEKFILSDNAKEDLKKIQAHYAKMNMEGKHKGCFSCGVTDPAVKSDNS